MTFGFKNLGHLRNRFSVSRDPDQEFSLKWNDAPWFNVDHAGNGRVRLSGGRGDDDLDRGPGNDRLFGGRGNDILDGKRGDDRLFGGRGDDTLTGDSGNDFLWGGCGNDSLLGGADNDILFGGRGDDTLVGGAGNDVLRGGRGSDTYRFEDDFGQDVIFGFQSGEGSGDAIDLSALEIYDLASVLDNAIESGNDTVLRLDSGSITLKGVQQSELHSENFIFTEGEESDTVESSVSHTLSENKVTLICTGTDDIDGTGNGLDNTLVGNSGSNTLNGGAGNDSIYGGGGDDTLDGGAGAA